MGHFSNQRTGKFWLVISQLMISLIKFLTAQDKLGSKQQTWNISPDIQCHWGKTTWFTCYFTRGKCNLHPFRVHQPAFDYCYVGQSSLRSGFGMWWGQTDHSFFFFFKWQMTSVLRTPVTCLVWDQRLSSDAVDDVCDRDPGMEPRVVRRLGLLYVGTIPERINPVETPHLKVLVHLQGSVPSEAFTCEAQQQTDSQSQSRKGLRSSGDHTH